MFYSQLILAKKGPLGTIWIAAHLERKLRKNQVTETNISVSVDSILFPEAPIALRLSGHLLLGVVRIYSRKVNYLFHDCSEALTKIKQAFHSGAVDLPPDASTAPFHAITLPENFDLDEFEPLGERESMLIATGAVDQHVTTRELITLQDTSEENIYFGSSQIGLDDRLPQVDLPRMGLDFEEEREKEAQERDRSPRMSLEEEVAPSVEEYRIDFDRLDQMEAMDVDQLPPMTPAAPTMVDVDVQMEERPVEMPEEFEQLAPVTEEQPAPVTEEPELVTFEEQPVAEGSLEVVDVPDELVPALEAAAELLPVPVSPAPLQLEMEDIPEVETLRSAVEAPTDQAPDLFAFEREMTRPSEDFPARDIDEPMAEAEQPLQLPERVEELQETSVATVPGLTSPRGRPSLAQSDLPADDDLLATLLGGRSTPSLRVLPTPSDAGPSQRPRRAPKPPPRKRKPILDVQMILNGDQMRQQLAETADIRRVRKKAPCTPHELWTAERLVKGSQVFNEPSIPGVCSALRELFTRVLVPGRANLPLAEPQREPTPEVTREEVLVTPRADAPVEERETDEQRISEPQPEDTQPMAAEPATEPVEEPGLELPVMEPPIETVAEMQPEAGLDLPAEGEIGLQPEQISEAVFPSEEAVEFPVLETEPEAASEPHVPSSAPAAEPVSIETEAQEESDIKEEGHAQEVALEVPAVEEEVEVTGFRGPDIGEEESLAEQPEVLQEVAAEAEAVAEAVAEGTAVVLEVVNGRTIIVLEDDGTIIDEGPSLFAIKEEVVGEVIQQENLGFLGEPRETVFLQDDDDDLNEETEPYGDSVQDVTVEGFSGWSARTRAVGGYLQGVFESLGASLEGRQEDSPRIGLDHTLRGKTRREAARLFFETLVLKTKDYVDVDQPQPYGEVYLSARPKLLKGSF